MSREKPNIDHNTIVKAQLDAFDSTVLKAKLAHSEEKLDLTLKCLNIIEGLMSR